MVFFKRKKGGGPFFERFFTIKDGFKKNILSAVEYRYLKKSIFAISGKPVDKKYWHTVRSRYGTQKKYLEYFVEVNGQKIEIFHGKKIYHMKKQKEKKLNRVSDQESSSISENLMNETTIEPQNITLNQQYYQAPMIIDQIPPITPPNTPSVICADQAKKVIFHGQSDLFYSSAQEQGILAGLEIIPSLAGNSFNVNCNYACSPADYRIPTNRFVPNTPHFLEYNGQQNNFVRYETPFQMIPSLAGNSFACHVNHTCPPYSMPTTRFVPNTPHFLEYNGQQNNFVRYETPFQMTPSLSGHSFACNVSHTYPPVHYSMPATRFVPSIPAFWEHNEQQNTNAQQQPFFDVPPPPATGQKATFQAPQNPNDPPIIKVNRINRLYRAKSKTPLSTSPISDSKQTRQKSCSRQYTKNKK